MINDLCVIAGSLQRTACLTTIPSVLAAQGVRGVKKASQAADNNKRCWGSIPPASACEIPKTDGSNRSTSSRKLPKRLLIWPESYPVLSTSHLHNQFGSTNASKGSVAQSLMSAAVKVNFQMLTRRHLTQTHSPSRYLSMGTMLHPSLLQLRSGARHTVADRMMTGWRRDAATGATFGVRAISSGCPSRYSSTSLSSSP